MMGGPLLPLGTLVECAQHCERHRGDDPLAPVGRHEHYGITLVDRAADLEMGYNLNDCVELRWGAPDKSDEASTCKRHASSAQRAKMTDYRAWFRERHWPHA